jgi:hypothetical protein
MLGREAEVESLACEVETDIESLSKLHFFIHEAIIQYTAFEITNMNCIDWCSLFQARTEINL